MPSRSVDDMTACTHTPVWRKDQEAPEQKPLAVLPQARPLSKLRPVKDASPQLDKHPWVTTTDFEGYTPDQVYGEHLFLGTLSPPGRQASPQALATSSVALGNSLMVAAGAWRTAVEHCYTRHQEMVRAFASGISLCADADLKRHLSGLDMWREARLLGDCEQVTAGPIDRAVLAIAPLAHVVEQGHGRRVYQTELPGETLRIVVHACIDKPGARLGLVVDIDNHAELSDVFAQICRDEVRRDPALQQVLQWANRPPRGEGVQPCMLADVFLNMGIVSAAAGRRQLLRLGNMWSGVEAAASAGTLSVDVQEQLLWLREFEFAQAADYAVRGVREHLIEEHALPADAPLELIESYSLEKTYRAGDTDAWYILAPGSRGLRSDYDVHAEFPRTPWETVRASQLMSEYILQRYGQYPELVFKMNCYTVGHMESTGRVAGHGTWEVYGREQRQHAQSIQNALAWVHVLRSVPVERWHHIRNCVSSLRAQKDFALAEEIFCESLADVGYELIEALQAEGESLVLRAAYLGERRASLAKYQGPHALARLAACDHEEAIVAERGADVLAHRETLRQLALRLSGFANREAFAKCMMDTLANPNDPEKMAEIDTVARLVFAFPSMTLRVRAHKEASQLRYNQAAETMRSRFHAKLLYDQRCRENRDMASVLLDDQIQQMAWLQQAPLCDSEKALATVDALRAMTDELTVKAARQVGLACTNDLDSYNNQGALAHVVRGLQMGLSVPLPAHALLQTFLTNTAEALECLLAWHVDMPAADVAQTLMRAAKYMARVNDTRAEIIVRFRVEQHIAPMQCVEKLLTIKKSGVFDPATLGLQVASVLQEFAINPHALAQNYLDDLEAVARRFYAC